MRASGQKATCGSWIVFELVQTVEFSLVSRLGTQAEVAVHDEPCILRILDSLNHLS